MKQKWKSNQFSPSIIRLVKLKRKINCFFFASNVKSPFFLLCSGNNVGTNNFIYLLKKWKIQWTKIFYAL